MAKILVGKRHGVWVTWNPYHHRRHFFSTWEQAMKKADHIARSGR